MIMNEILEFKHVSKTLAGTAEERKGVFLNKDQVESFLPSDINDNYTSLTKKSGQVLVVDEDYKTVYQRLTGRTYLVSKI